jgi:hypothetical protein
MSCLKVLSIAKLAPITILPEPIGSILRLAEHIERGDRSAWQSDGIKWLP